MGSCFTKYRKNYHRLPRENNKKVQDDAKILIEENFKIVDYTFNLENLIDLKELAKISGINYYFPDYIPIEIRCLRGQKERKTEHSHLLIVFNQYNDEDIVEIGLTADYSPYGFAITIGNMRLIDEIYSIKGTRLEYLYLPKTNNQKNISIGEVVEWAYLHKDEPYRNPKRNPQLNMGRRIFQFVTEKLSNDNLVMIQNNN